MSGKKTKCRGVWKKLRGFMLERGIEDNDRGRDYCEKIGGEEYA